MALSFTGAIGYGANTTGGRGGQVIKVTNSNDAGVGSLRWAIEDFSGPRIVVFDVNEVHLTGNITLNNGDVTIAGQTAGGVQVTGATIKFRAANVIMRGMLFRPGDSSVGQDPDTRDAMSVGTTGINVDSIMIDHCSFEWAVDECVDFYKNVTNLTFSNNIVAQALRDSIHPKGVHSKGMLISTASGPTAQNLTICRNLFAFNVARNPRIEHGNNIEFVNNYIYGAGDQQRATHLVSNSNPATNVNILNNFYLAGPDTRELQNSNLKLDTSGTFVYIDGNLQLDVNGNELSEVWHGSGSPSNAPGFPGSGLDIMPVTEVKDFVLANVGANPSAPDAPDLRILDFATFGGGVIVDSVVEAGGYASTPFTPQIDANDDGIPDSSSFTDTEAYVNDFFTSAAPPPDPDPDLLAQIAALEAQVVSLTAELSAALSATAALQAQITDLEARIAVLEAPTAVLEALIVSLEGQVVSLEGQVAGLTVELVEADVLSAALLADNIDLEAQVVSITADLTAATQKIATAIGVLSV